jgi:hypothetical protein
MAVHMCSCMQMPCGTWEGHPAIYKVWDVCKAFDPLLDLQARLDAYGAMLPLQAGPFVNACVTAWLADSLMPKAVLLIPLNLLPKHTSYNHHKYKPSMVYTICIAYTAIGRQHT